MRVSIISQIFISLLVPFCQSFILQFSLIAKIVNYAIEFRDMQFVLLFRPKDCDQPADLKYVFMLPIFIFKNTSVKAVNKMQKSFRIIHLIEIHSADQLTVRKAIDPVEVDRQNDILIMTGEHETIAEARNLQEIRDVTWKIGIALKLNKNFIWTDGGNYGDPMSPITAEVYNWNNNPFQRNVLNGRVLKAGACEAPPEIYKIGEDSSGNAIIDGLHFRAFSAAATVFNFTYEITFTGQDYGTYHPENGSWTGMYTLVTGHYPKCDIILLTAFVEIFGHLDKPNAFRQAELSFHVARPTADIPWNSVLLPFNLQTWISTLIMLAVLSLVQHISSRLVRGKKKPQTSAIFQPVSLLLEQGLQNIPPGTKVTSMFILLATMVLGTAYKSSLRDKMMFPKNREVPLTFLRLSEMPEFKSILYVIGELELEFFKHSVLPAAVKLQKVMTKVRDPFECYGKALIENGKFACVSWDSIGLYVAKKLTMSPRIDPMLLSQEAIYSLYISMGFPEKSLITDKFRGYIGWVFEAGLLNMWQEQILYDSKLASGEALIKEKGEVYRAVVKVHEILQDGKIKPMQLRNVIVAFIIWVILMMVSGIFGFIEIAGKKRVKK